MKQLNEYVIEALSKEEKKKFIGLDFTKVWKIFPDETRANKITFVFDDTKLWIKDEDSPQAGISWVILTKNKNEAGKNTLKNYLFHATNVRIEDWDDFNDQFNPTAAYGLRSDDEVLWVSDISGNKVSLKYTPNDERLNRINEL